MDKNPKQKNIYDEYRETLEMPHLTDEEIDKIRLSVQLIAQSICEHVWGKDFY